MAETEEEQNLNFDATQDDALAYDLMQIDLFALLSAWNVPWQKSRLSIGMLERRFPVDEIVRMVSERTQSVALKPSIVFPQSGWLDDFLNQVRPGALQTGVLTTEILHIADALTGDLRVSTGAKTAEETSSRLLAEPLYREALRSFSNYMPENLSDEHHAIYQDQRNLLVQSLNMALSSHLLLSGIGSENVDRMPPSTQPKTAAPQVSSAPQSSDALSTSSAPPAPPISSALPTSSPISQNDALPTSFSPTAPPSTTSIVGFAGVIEKVLRATNDMAAQMQEQPAAPVKEEAKPKLPFSFMAQGREEDNSNPKHLIRTANEDLMSNKPRLPILEKYSRALEMLGIDATKSGDELNSQMEGAARRYLETSYSTPIIGGLFFAADKILSLRDYELARAYLLLDARLRAVDTEQFGFSKYLNEFMHNFTLAKALMQMGDFGEALRIVEEWAKTAELYESPQDITGRTLGSVLVTKVLARYAFLLELNNRKQESEQWWERVRSRPESLPAICELCADRLEVEDIENAKKFLSRLTDYDVTDVRTSDLVFYWWLLTQTKDDEKANSLDVQLQARPDYPSSISDFAGIELLSQRHECEFAKPFIAKLEELLNSTDLSVDYDLINVYLRMALAYQQFDLNEIAGEYFAKGAKLIESSKANSLEADPKQAMKQAFVQAEFSRQYSHFQDSQK